MKVATETQSAPSSANEVAPVQSSDSASIAKRKVKLGEFGNGRYSPAMSELYHDSQRLLGFDNKQAHVTASRLGIDAGQLGASKVKLSYGKSVDKSGKMTLKELTQGVKILSSWAMNVASVCSQLDGARKTGLVINDCTMDKGIMAFVNEAADRIEAE
jgi:hypothetical protein